MQGHVKAEAIRRTRGRRTGRGVPMIGQFTKWIPTPLNHFKVGGMAQQGGMGQTVVGEIQHGHERHFVQGRYGGQSTTGHVQLVQIAKQGEICG